MTNRNIYRVEPQSISGQTCYTIRKSVLDCGAEGAPVVLAVFTDRIEANAKAIEMVAHDRDHDIEADIFQAMH